MSRFEKLIGKRLKEIRKERGLSLEEVGQAIGVTGSHISQIEKGVRQPSLQLIAAFAEFFDYSPTYFVRGESGGIGPGEEIKKIRSERNISIGDLSKITGINFFRLGEAESSHEQLTQDELIKVAVALGLEKYYFCKEPSHYINKIMDISTIALGIEEDELKLLVEYLEQNINTGS